jgi:hypothetical protein
MWMDAVVSSRGVQLEYIPTDDMLAMQWLGDDLADLLIDAGRQRHATRESEFARRLGSAAEFVVLRAKEREGGHVIHVARIADSFGYDVEHRLGVRTARIEVKGAVESTSDGFFITRNEIAQARRHGAEWILVQVVFRSSIALKGEIAVEDISAVRILSSEQVCSLIPADTPHFSWIEAARVRPPVSLWSTYPLDLDATSSIQI